MNHFKIFLLVWLHIILFNSCITQKAVDTIDEHGVIALMHATIYPSPEADVIRNGTLIIKNGKIEAVRKFSEIAVPRKAKIIDCTGLTITAGFWNSHVHLTDPELSNAQNMQDTTLTLYLQQFLTQYGFTHAFDIGSFPNVTQAIISKVQSGRVKGPTILTTGTPFVPPNGTPFYLKAVGIQLPELNSVASANAMVSKHFNDGADGIKIFSGSPANLGGKEILMPDDIANEVVAVARKHKKPVFAHPSINEGLKVALSAGVDILAHTTPDGKKDWDADLVKKMTDARLIVTPTLKLWKWELQNRGKSESEIDAFTAVAIGQVRTYHKAGGKIMFGTDIGYMSDTNPLDEYVYLQKAGLRFRELLATLTTIPSEKFGYTNEFGTLRKGMKANVVVFSGDPEINIEALINVRYTIKDGEIIYQRK